MTDILLVELCVIADEMTEKYEKEIAQLVATGNRELALRRYGGMEAIEEFLIHLWALQRDKEGK